MPGVGPPTPREWLTRWDQQQAVYLPQREARFRAMLDAVGAVAEGRFLAVDLACGPGSLTERLLARYPEARVFAVDHDPVLLDLGQAALEEHRRRIAWVDADLRLPGWVDRLPTRPVDVVLSTTALHWFTESRLRAIYREIAGVLRPGGLLLNGDHLAYGPEEAAIGTLARTVRKRLEEEQRNRPGAESWDEWWDNLRAAGGRSAQFTERDRRFPRSHGEEPQVPLAAHVAALRDAGFASVGTIWQTFDNRVVAALR